MNKVNKKEYTEWLEQLSLTEREYFDTIYLTTVKYLEQCIDKNASDLNLLQFPIKVLTNALGQVATLMPQELREVTIQYHITHILENVQKNVGNLGILLSALIPNLKDDQATQVLEMLQDIEERAASLNQHRN